MSRSGYSEDLDDLSLGRWRGQVASAIRGKRGQKLLRDLLAALDAMPEKALVVGELETPEGEVCALGALGRARGLDMSQIDASEPDVVAGLFGIAEQLAQEIVYINDEWFDNKTPEERYDGMRKWVVANIREGRV